MRELQEATTTPSPLEMIADITGATVNDFVAQDPLTAISAETPVLKEAVLLNSHKTLLIGEAAKLDKVDERDDDPKCPAVCGKFNGYTCEGPCFCGYLDGEENGTCYDYSNYYNYYYVSYDSENPTPTEYIAAVS
ncbi:hypothetical protein MRX96_038446 [Rhipicephalus microplus]